MKALNILLSAITDSAKNITTLLTSIQENAAPIDRPTLILNLLTIKADLENVELIDGERREDMLTGALEGGSNDWYCLGDKAMAIIRKYPDKTQKQNTISEMMFRAIAAGETIPVHDIEEPEGEKIGEINIESIRKGEGLMKEKHPQHFSDLVQETDDCITADVWFQLATLGEIVYG